ncbi:hypothetical protein ACVWXN_006773 [Bradyrhizobium sp. i1.4.4]
MLDAIATAIAAFTTKECRTPSPQPVMTVSDQKLLKWFNPADPPTDLAEAARQRTRAGSSRKM